MKVFTLSALVLWLCNNEAVAANLPGPRVYVVTAAPKHLTIDEGRSAPRPFYYHNWRRIDSPENKTTTTTTTITTPKTKTPDLIFAEFESDKMKNIRKLLEKEKIQPTTTTMKPIYVPGKENDNVLENHVQLPQADEKTKEKDMTDYFALYNNLYNTNDNLPSPVYTPSTTTSTSKPSTTISTSTPPPNNNVEDIWHIIDSEKQNQYSGGWHEVPLSPENEAHDDPTTTLEMKKNEDNKDASDAEIDENFALPGFGTNGKEAENESRAIRTESNMRFPYINLKPFQMKNTKTSFDTYSNDKKGNNMYTSLDNFYDIKNPVRGEAQDVMSVRQPIDRYNPAQPYLPSEYGTKSKQSSPVSTPMKTVANLVPPPPPPAPKVTGDDFPAPATYESFPPYAPPLNPGPAKSKPSVTLSAPPGDSSDDSDSGPTDDMNVGYRYKPPSPPAQPFLPTVAPAPKPFGGYSYNKPMMDDDSPPMEVDDKPDFQGYTYNKPAPAPPMQAKPDFHGYHYSKPDSPPVPAIDHLPTYHDHGPPSHGPQDSDYPELIYGNGHGGKGGGKGAKDVDDMGMMPPPPPDAKPADDSGFPADFPGDFKFHDFDHDHDFYHHHHPTTTTTTTEMPRVNRYSYYYLGKKLYYLPLYFSVYFIIYVGALIIKAVLRHKIVYPNSWRPNDETASYFSKRSVDSWDLSSENLHEMTGRVTRAIASAAQRYMEDKAKKNP